MFDDLVALADFWPVGQVATVAFVQHLGRLSQGRSQLLGAFETFVLAFGDDVVLATAEAAVDEFAAGFQDFLGSVHLLGGASITLSNEFLNLLSLRSAFGLACFRLFLIHIDQAANARLEVCVAAQLEQGQELLDAFLLW